MQDNRRKVERFPTLGGKGVVVEQSKGVLLVCTIVRFEVRDPRRKVPKCHRQSMMPLAQLHHGPKQQLITSDHLPTSDNDGTTFYCHAQLSKANIGSLCLTMVHWILDDFSICQHVLAIAIAATDKPGNCQIMPNPLTLWLARDTPPSRPV